MPPQHALAGDDAHAATGDVVTKPERFDGYAPIESYGVLTDGRTAALIARDGRIDWWPVPTLDALPVCASILDADHGGYVVVAPAGDYDVTRRYLEGTNVLESVYATADGSVRITSSLNMAATGRLPWTELVSRVEGIEGSVPMKWVVAPGTQFNSTKVKHSIEQGVPVIRLGTHTVAILVNTEYDASTSKDDASGTIVATAGSKFVLAVLATDKEPVFVPKLDAIDRRLDDTIENWRRWSDLIAPSGQWHAAVVRSALVLKSLLAEYTGAIAAAATTSLPERIGGPKNWDYRFSWVRDSSFTIDALINLGLAEEVHNAVAWLLQAIQRNGPELHVYYTLEGTMPGDETRLRVPGYRQSQPVRDGNDAAAQVQLGNYGDVFDSVYRYVDQGHVLDVTSQRLLCELAERCCDSWREPDSGIWELKGIEHYTISKIGCWVALDRMVKLWELGQAPEGRVKRWRRERDAIQAYVEERCWSTTKQSYTFYADCDELDASVLLSARTGFDTGERLASTVVAIEAELARGPLLYRYTGVDAEEGAFVACTFWWIEALVALGQIERATTLMDQAVALTNDVGLLAEQIDPVTGSFLGNTPQALSHLALINAAHAVANAAHPQE